ncbi:MAG TPA: SGNH/GDSL hydrolase family protein [Bryobacteraceae bacterium]|nr:SGNH/GDSL hydrolase family protein [Bryobacteraceae bacterium]
MPVRDNIWNMETLRLRCIRIWFLLVASVLSSAQDPFYLKSGDTVVFYGDSITDQRLYTTFVETYALTRFPQYDLTFIHSGWGGDRVGGGGGGPIDLRLKRDVLAYKPTVVTIMLGMNDGGYRAFNEPAFQTYATGYTNIVKSLKAALPGVRITAIEPSPYDDVTREPLFPGGYNAVLVRYGGLLRELGAAENLKVADMNSPVVQDLVKANEMDPEGAKKLLPDRVHPGAAGHLLMAKALLKAWDAPAVVTSVSIDASKPDTIKTENTTITDVKSAENELSWSQLDGALPFPILDPALSLAVKASDIEQSLNRQPLRITGLAPKQYRLTIDGELVGSFSAGELAEGVNLAMLPTPMVRQAADVHSLTLKHTSIHNTRWRQVQTPLEKDALPATQDALKALDALEKEIVQRQKTAARPKPHQYRLTGD